MSFMTKEENNLFHANYKYMWNKLSTTYYHVKTGTPKASHIQGGAYLPAYSICSKCFKDGYEPSIGTVDSIVQFYKSFFVFFSPSSAINFSSYNFSPGLRPKYVK